MKNRYLFILILSFIINNGFSQKGNLYLHNYQMPFPNIDYNNLDVIQGYNQVMYFANTKGVISYDGKNWAIIKTPGSPVSLEIDTGYNRIYAGCTNGFGYIEKDPTGLDKYISLSDSFLNIENVSNILQTTYSIYFYTSKKIFQFSKEFLEIEKVWSTRIHFNGIFTFNEQIYINEERKGVQRVSNRRLRPISGGNRFINTEIITQNPYINKKILIGTNRSELYIFDGHVFKKFNIKNQDYISGNILSSSTSISDKTLALGTRSGGCIIVDKISGKTIQTINYQTGLPDDEVLSMFTDAQGGLWICNEIGITRTNITLPVENFSYPGLEGNITSMLNYNNRLYVSTSEGLFYLGRVTKLAEVEHFIKKEHKKTTSTRSYRTIKSVSKLIKVTFSSKNGPIVKKIPIKIDIPIDSVATSTMDVFTDKSTRKNYALQSIPYVFKQIKGISGKCVQLIPYKGKILVGSNMGLFEADTTGAKPILKDVYVNFIHQSETQPNLFYIALEDGIRTVRYNRGRWKVNSMFRQIYKGIYSIAESQNSIWLGSENQIFRLRLNKYGSIESVRSYPIENSYSENIIVRKTYAGIIFISASGIYTFNYTDKRLEKEPGLQYLISSTSKVFFNQPDFTWIQGIAKWYNINTINTDPENIAYLKLFDEIEDIYMDDKKNIWVISDNSIYTINSKKGIKKTRNFDIAIRRFTGKNGIPIAFDEKTLNYKNNAVKFKTAGLYYLSESSTQYQHWMQGLNKSWSSWSNEAEVDFPWLPSGSYTFHVRAKNIFGQISHEESYSFKIGTPFWKTWWFYFIVFLLVSSGVFLFIRNRIKNLEKAKILLQQKVDEATSEIRKQKDDLEEKNKKITDSINYARRIQEAILPISEDIRRVIPNSFILFRPRDIVSGDFYWFLEEEDVFVIIAADCTGHGVPGAFMSMIGNTLLNTIIKEKQIFDPAEILYALDSEIVNALKQSLDTSLTPDGMDLSICVVNTKEKKMSFSSANNSMYMIHPGTAEDEIVRVKGDSFGIGGTLVSDKVKTFTTHNVELHEETCCYIFSDGYPDQFSGQTNRKFTINRLRKLLYDIHDQDFDYQREILNENIESWMGDYHQIDDITMIGFKLAK